MQYMMTRVTDMRIDLQLQSSGWLFKSPLPGGGHIVSAPLQAAQLVVIKLYADGIQNG